MSTMKCFTKKTILEANDLAIKRNYNRQLDPAFVRNLRDDVVFPAFFVMPHEHANGVKVEMHYRCWVSFDAEGTTGFIDCDSRIFESLPEIEVPAKKDVSNG